MAGGPSPRVAAPARSQTEEEQDSEFEDAAYRAVAAASHGLSLYAISVHPLLPPRMTTADSSASCAVLHPLFANERHF